MAGQSSKYFIQIPLSKVTGFKLGSTDKLVYGNIYTILNANDRCFISNKKLGENVEVSERSVSRAITKLKKIGLIDVHLIYKKDSKEIDQRYITLSDRYLGGDKNVTTPTTNLSTPSRQKWRDPHDKNGVGNKEFNKESNIYEDDEEALKIYISAFGNPSSLIQRKLIKLIKNNGSELFTYAIELAATGNAKSPYNFIKRLLDDWSKHKLTNLDAVKSYVEKFKQSKAKKGSRGRKPVKEELPDWAKNDKIAQMTPEEREERNRRLAEEHNELSKDKNNNSSLDKNLEDNNKKIRSFRKSNEEPKKKTVKRNTTTLQEYLSKMGGIINES